MRIIGKSSIISESSQVSDLASIWNNVHIRERVVIGDYVIIGDYTYIDCDVTIGKGCKIQNACQIFGPSTIGEGVFIGPGTILTNDKYPRAISPTGEQKTSTDWERIGIVIEGGASIGAGAICVAPLTIGSWAVVAAGSVVTRSVPPFALVAGNPARFIHWVGRKGIKLIGMGKGVYECPDTGDQYLEMSPSELRLNDSRF